MIWEEAPKGSKHLLRASNDEYYHESILSLIEARRSIVNLTSDSHVKFRWLPVPARVCYIFSPV